MIVDINNKKISFLTGGGEMGKLIRNKDWSATSVGDPENWPQSLRTTLSIILHSKFPMFLFWGPELICFYNDAYRPSLGKTGKHPDMLGGPAADYWKEIWSDIKPLIDQVMEGGEASWSEDQLLPIYRNGKMEDVYWTFSYSPVSDESGNPAGVFVTCSETTGKVNAFKSLELSNRRYRDNIMQAPVAMCIFRGENHVVEIANDLMLELWNKPLEEVLNKPIFEGLPEAKGQGLEDLVNHVFNTGERFSANERPVILPRNGALETTYINFVYEPLKDPDGTITGIVAIATDVTMQVLARQKIEESEQQFRALANNIPNLAWIAKADGHIFWYNNRWYEYTGKTPEEMEGWGWQSVHDPALLPIVLRKWQRSIENGQPFEMTFPMKGADGTFQPFLTRITPIRDSEGKIIRWFGTNTNISEQKKAEEQFRALADEAPMWVWTVDKEANITYANPCLLDFIGLTHYSEFLGKIWEKIIPAEDAVLVYKVFNDAFARQIPYDLECRFKHAVTNLYEWFHLKGVPRFEQNELTGFIGTGVNIHQQKMQLLSLQESEQRFQGAVEAVQGVLWTNNAQGEMEGDQPGWASLTGQSREEYQGYGWASAIHPDDAQPTLDAWNESVRTGSLFDFEHRIRLKNGTWGRFSIRAVPLINQDGTVREWVGVHTDVTQQRHSEEALVNANKLLELAFKNFPAAVFLLNAQGEIIFTNETGVQAFGALTAEKMLSEKDLPGLRKKTEEYFDRYDEAGAPVASDGFPTVIVHQTGQASQGVFKLINKKTKDVYWCLIYASPLLDPEGNLTHILSVTMDVTAQKTSEEKIRLSEERFRMLAEALPQLVWVTDDKGIAEFASRKWQAYTGIDPDVVESWSDIVHPDDLENINQTWAHSLATGVKYNGEVRLKSKTGEYRWHAVRGEPVFNDERRIIKWVGAYNDIHVEKEFREELEKQVENRTEELARVNDQLTEKNKELEKSNKELQAFAYVSSHDLQEPLRKIQTFVNRIALYESQNFTDNGKDYFLRIQDSAKRMQQLIQDLLAFSRLSTEERIFETIDLNKMVEALKEELQEELIEKGGTIETPKLDAIKVISFQFRQLLHNLFCNSLKFIKPGVSPHILIKSNIIKGSSLKTLKLAPDKMYCHIVVSDNGIGFEPQYSEKIFEVFQRLHGKTEYIGTGVGLAIVKKIVENHNGFITATGAPDQGATFEVYIPCD